MMPSTNAPPPYSAGQQQVVTVQPTPPPANLQSHSRKWKGMRWTGIIQIVLGFLTIIMGVVSTAALNNSLPFLFSDIGSPIWRGILFYAVAGILGIVSGFRKNSSLAIGDRVMSIFACLAAFFVIGFASYPVASYNGIRCDYNDRPCNKDAAQGVYVTLISLGIMEFVVAIAGASMTCGPVCKGGRTAHTVVHYQAQPHLVVATQPQGPAFYNVPTGQPQVANPAQQNVYPQA